MSRESLLRRALVLSGISIGLSGMAGGAAVVAGLSSGSLSLVGFGADAAIDASASVALVWRFFIEGRAPHRANRAEKLAEGTVGVALLALTAYLIVGSVRALMAGSHPESTTVGTALLLFSVGTLPPLAYAKHRVAAELGSRALRADSLLTAFAAILALISLVGLVLSEIGGLSWADGVGALVVAAIVGREGLGAVMATRSADAF